MHPSMAEYGIAQREGEGAIQGDLVVGHILILNALRSEGVRRDRGVFREIVVWCRQRVFDRIVHRSGLGHPRGIVATHTTYAHGAKAHLV